MAKDLPIQYVHYREDRDRFKPEGGGGTETPAWCDFESIPQHLSAIEDGLRETSERFGANGTTASTLPVLMTASLHPKGTAKSYRHSVHDIFDVNGKRNVIGMQDKETVLIKLDNRSDFDAVESRIETDIRGVSSNKMKMAYATVTGVAAFKPDIEDDINDGDSIKIILADYHDSDLNGRQEEYFRRACNENGINVSSYDITSELKAYSVEAIDKNKVACIASMDGVISIHKMPYIELQFVPNTDGFLLNILTPKAEVEYPIVGLMDSGVDCHQQHLEPWICNGVNDDIAGVTGEPGHSVAHGTAVASILIYGDQLAGKNITGCSPLKVESCVVNSDTRISENEFMVNVRDAVETHPEIKVWNLSQGLGRTIKSNTFSDLAKFLDGLQKRHKILICKSAGNIHKGEEGNPVINEGADSVLSLVVGSINQAPLSAKDGSENARSVFSRIGYGPEHIIKPDLVSYGGNTDTGIRTLSSSLNPYSRSFGTSFSTPRVSALAATLGFKLGGEFDPLLLKAMLIHNAYYPHCDTQDKGTTLRELGFGLHDTLQNMLGNAPDEVTMYWPFDFSVKGDNYQLLDFPFPESLVSVDGYFEGEIIVTMVCDPILMPSEANEYCQTDIDVLLETYAGIRVGQFTSNNSMDRNEYHMDGSTNILNNGLYTRKKEKMNPGERELIEDQKKYAPVKKYHVNLSDITNAKKKFIKSDRRWGLKLELHSRDGVIQEVGKTGEDKRIRAMVAITIKDPEHRGVVYDECIRKLDEYAFVHENIRQRIDVRLDN